MKKKKHRLVFDWSITDCTPTSACVDLAEFFVKTGGSIKDTLAVRPR